MAEDSISNEDYASGIAVEWWGARLSKSIASIFARHSTSTTSTNSTSTTMMMDIQQQPPPPPPPIIDVQTPVPAKPSTTNALNNDWLHFCIMALLEGKYGENSISR